MAEKTEKKIIENVKDFNLEHIFDCGQCFRWEREKDGSYTGIAFGKVVNMQTIPSKGVADQVTLIIDNCTSLDYDLIWKDYLDMTTDYGKIKKSLSMEDSVMAMAISKGHGIRLLRQDLWETLISFIISQNNNIPRIKGCVNNLARLFGESAGIYRGKEFFSLPSAEVLASLSEEDLAPVKLGYRSRYLIETAKRVIEKGLPSNAEELSECCGVGPKVANCVLLFGLYKYDAFPIDVWMRRVMHKLYDIDEADMKTMAEYAKSHFGDLSGIAQQYLFWYMRTFDEN